jgi:hypothetical protein
MINTADIVAAIKLASGSGKNKRPALSEAAEDDD